MSQEDIMKLNHLQAAKENEELRSKAEFLRLEIKQIEDQLEKLSSYMQSYQEDMRVESERAESTISSLKQVIKTIDTEKEALEQSIDTSEEIKSLHLNIIDAKATLESAKEEYKIDIEANRSQMNSLLEEINVARKGKEEAERVNNDLSGCINSVSKDIKTDSIDSWIHCRQIRRNNLKNSRNNYKCEKLYDL